MVSKEGEEEQEQQGREKERLREGGEVGGELGLQLGFLFYLHQLKVVTLIFQVTRIRLIEIRSV